MSSQQEQRRQKRLARHKKRRQHKSPGTLPGRGSRTTPLVEQILRREQIRLGDEASTRQNKSKVLGHQKTDKSLRRTMAQ